MCSRPSSNSPDRVTNMPHSSRTTNLVHLSRYPHQPKETSPSLPFNTKELTTNYFLSIVKMLTSRCRLSLTILTQLPFTGSTEAQALISDKISHLIY